jgi:hypothetical protein
MEVLEDDEQREAQQQMQMFAAVHGHAAAAAAPGAGCRPPMMRPTSTIMSTRSSSLMDPRSGSSLQSALIQKIERLLMWLGACEVLDMCGNQVVAFGQVLYLVQEYELSCRTPGAWFAELDVYCIASEERVTIRFRLAKEHFAKDNSPAAQ